MTTASFSSRVRHDSDATYQEWRDEFITQLGVLVTGGVLAADETNITAGAGARPGANTEQGYAVYHISDSLHGTAPIYIRFGFGTHSGTTSPRISVGVGTATNGSGTLSGTASSATGIFNSNSAATTDTARQSYMCAVAGFFGFQWKIGTTSCATFFICRTCDSTGTPTVTGAMASWGCSSGEVGAHGFRQRQAYRYAATAAAYTARTENTQGCLGITPQTPSSSSVGSDIQVYLGWTITPRAEPLFGVCGVYATELAVGGTFSATLVGSTARTYITLQYTTAGAGTFDAANVLNCAMLWE